jgi:hypothetical protein
VIKLFLTVALEKYRYAALLYCRLSENVKMLKGQYDKIFAPLYTSGSPDSGAEAFQYGFVFAEIFEYKNFD